MTLNEVIINCGNYEDSDEIINVVFAKMINNAFDLLSDAKVIELTHEEMEMKLIDMENSRCPGYLINNIFKIKQQSPKNYTLGIVVFNCER